MTAPVPENSTVVRRAATARLPTRHGEFTMHAYTDESTGAEHVALVHGDVTADNVLLRIHSECLTGDIFGSLRCDCGEQLALAMERIAQEAVGLVIYMRGHEGRGIGIVQKLRAYALQDQGMDTVEANVALGLPIDARKFNAAAAILQDLNVGSVRLMSNNPLKILALQELGIHVVGREAHEVEPNAESGAYLYTKRDKLGHLLSLDL
jgi:GTP cyclohydrolase II